MRCGPLGTLTPILRLSRGPVVMGFLLLLPIFLPFAHAATSPGSTVALVNAGQLTRDASSAIPVIGFGMTATTAERLISVRVAFLGAGFDPGNDQDLRAISTNPSTSGVAIFRDTGINDDVLDTGDLGVAPSSVNWAGSDVELDFTGVNEQIPSSVTGTFHWIITLRTADVSGNLIDGDQIIARVPVNGIVATSVPGIVSQPVVAVQASLLTVRLTRAADLVPGGRWVGPDRVAVNSAAVLGFTIVDGGITINRGISDYIAEIRLRLNDISGSVTSGSLKPLTTDSASSGIGLYRDDGTLNDAWDVSDSPVSLAAVVPTAFPVGGTVFTMTIPSPGLKVPAVNSGTLDFFFVIRTRNILTGDQFTLELERTFITVQGVLGSSPGSVDSSLRTPLINGELESSLVKGDSTPPGLRNLQWFADSPYLFASGLSLHFSNAMTTVQTAFASGEARDDESGLAQAVFSSEPSLASSPAPQTLTGAGIWRIFAGAYGIDASSLGTSSPAVVTITDQVGNSIDSLSAGGPYSYTFQSGRLIILPKPGWQSNAHPYLWVDTNGRLWFSNLIAGTATATLTVDIASLNGFPLNSASFTAESSLAASPSPSSFTFPAGTFSTTLTVNYMVDSRSTDASSPVSITVTDTSGAFSTMTFSYGLDNQGPGIGIVAPPATPAVSGNFIARATVTDALTSVDRVQFQVDATGTLVDAFYDGTAYYYPFTSTLFADGSHRVIVRATDKVGNINAAAVDVVFSNAPPTPPIITVASPASNERTLGVMEVKASVSAPSGVKRVTISVFGQTQEMVFNPATGLYETRLETRGVANGAYQATITAEDQAGRTSTKTTSFQVKNEETLNISNLLWIFTLLFLVVAFVTSLLVTRKWLRPRAIAGPIVTARDTSAKGQ